MTKRLFCLLGITALLCLPARPSAAGAPARIPLSEINCFQLQFLLRLPTLEEQQFIQDVADLQDQEQTTLTPEQASGTIHRLRVEADRLRFQENADYTQLGTLLIQMGAPHALLSWVTAATDRVSKQVVLSKDEQKDAKTDPDTAAILATLDETQTLKTDSDDQLPIFQDWLSLTEHREGLWAGEVGGLAADLQVSLAEKTQPRLAIAVAHSLQSTAPGGTPSAVRQALSLLTPNGGNLGHLVPAVTTDVSPEKLTQAHDLLLTAFSSQSLAGLGPGSQSSAPK